MRLKLIKNTVLFSIIIGLTLIVFTCKSRTSNDNEKTIANGSQAISQNTHIDSDHDISVPTNILSSQNIVV